jgi:replicative DNA helicase
MNADQLAPKSLEAEYATLGAILISEGYSLEEIPMLSYTDFYDNRHATIFKAMRTLMNRAGTFNYMTLNHELKTAGKLDDIGGPTYLLDLVTNTPSSLGARQYGQIVMEMAYRRRMIAYAQKVADTAHSGETNIQKLFQVANEGLNDLASTQVNRPRTNNALMSQYHDKLTDAVRNNTILEPYDTGFRLLNKLWGRAYSPGAFIGIIKYMNAGGSYFVLQLGMNAARSGIPVLFVSLESTPEDMAERQIAVASGLPNDDVSNLSLRESRYEQAIQVAGDLANLPLEIEVIESLEEIENRIADMSIRYDMKEVIVIIDDLDTLAGLMYGGSEYASYIKLFPRILPLALKTGACIIGTKQARVPKFDTTPDNQTLYDKLNPTIASAEGGKTLVQKASMVTAMWGSDWIREKFKNDFSDENLRVGCELMPGRIYFKRLRTRNTRGGIEIAPLVWNPDIPRFEDVPPNASIKQMEANDVEISV